jgi:membrane protein
MKIKNIFTGRFFNKLGDDNILDMAASLSYYTALSLSPLLVLIITFVSFMGEGFKTELTEQVQELVGGQAAAAIQMIITSADQRETLRNASTIFGFVTLLLSAGGIFQELRMSLNRIFEVEVSDHNTPTKNVFLQTSLSFFKQRIFNMGMVLTFVFILIVSLVVSSLLSLWLQGTDLLIGQLINFGISTLVFTLLFAAIYYFLPQKRMRLKPTLLSGLITAILFSIGKSLIGLYLGQSAVASSYGAAGSMVILLMWVYYSSVVIFLSAEISHQLGKEAFHGPVL